MVERRRKKSANKWWKGRKNHPQYGEPSVNEGITGSDLKAKQRQNPCIWQRFYPARRCADQGEYTCRSCGCIYGNKFMETSTDCPSLWMNKKAYDLYIYGAIPAIKERIWVGPNLKWMKQTITK